LARMGRFDRLTETATQAKQRMLANALTSACEVNQPEIIPKILAKFPGAVNHPNDEGEFALHVAAKHGHVECLKLVQEAGAKVDPINSGGLTPLHLCCRWGKAGAVKELVRRQAHRHARCPRGYTPLHEAAEHGHEHSIRELVVNGEVDPLLLNENKKTPRDITTAWGRTELSEYLHKYEVIWFSNTAVVLLKLRKDSFSWLWSLPRSLLRGRIFSYLMPNQWSVEAAQEQFEEMGEPLEVDENAANEVNKRQDSVPKQKEVGSEQEVIPCTKQDDLGDQPLLSARAEQEDNRIQKEDIIAEDLNLAEDRVNPVISSEDFAKDSMEEGKEEIMLPTPNLEDETFSKDSMEEGKEEIILPTPNLEDETFSKGSPLRQQVASARKMDRACAAVLEAQKQFASFQRRHMVELKRMNVPTDAVRLVLEAACLIVYWPLEEDNNTERETKRTAPSAQQLLVSKSCDGISSENTREQRQDISPSLNHKTPRSRVASEQNARSTKNREQRQDISPRLNHKTPRSRVASEQNARSTKNREQRQDISPRLNHKTPRSRVASEQNARSTKDSWWHFNSLTLDTTPEVRRMQTAFQALCKGKGQWDDTRMLFSQPDFHTMIMEYDPERFSNARDLVELLKNKYVSHPKFTEEGATKGSLVCGALFKWINGLLLMELPRNSS